HRLRPKDTPRLAQHFGSEVCQGDARGAHLHLRRVRGMSASLRHWAGSKGFSVNSAYGTPRNSPKLRSCNSGLSSILIPERAASGAAVMRARNKSLHTMRTISAQQIEPPIFG